MRERDRQGDKATEREREPGRDIKHVRERESQAGT